MKKTAARYASQPSLTLQGGGFPQTNRFSSLMSPFGLGSKLPMRPNPIAQQPAPTPTLANSAGIMQAAQKAAAMELFEAQPGDLDRLLAVVMGSVKSADVQGAANSVPGKTSALRSGQGSGGALQQSGSMAANRPGQALGGGGAMMPQAAGGASPMAGMKPTANPMVPNAGMAQGIGGPKMMGQAVKPGLFGPSALSKIGTSLLPVPGQTAPQPAMPQMPGQMPPQQPPAAPGMAGPPMDQAAMGGAPGQPMPPGQPGQPMPGQPAGAMPPTAPMQDAMPQPLPANPRPNPPAPKTSAQAMQEAAMLKAMEAKQAPVPGHEAAEAMDDQSMALGAKIASFRAEGRGLSNAGLHGMVGGLIPAAIRPSVRALDAFGPKTGFDKQAGPGVGTLLNARRNIGMIRNLGSMAEKPVGSRMAIPAVDMSVRDMAGRAGGLTRPKGAFSNSWQAGYTRPGAGEPTVNRHEVLHGIVNQATRDPELAAKLPWLGRTAANLSRPSRGGMANDLGMFLNEANSWMGQHRTMPGKALGLARFLGSAPAYAGQMRTLPGKAAMLSPAVATPAVGIGAVEMGKQGGDDDVLSVPGEPMRGWHWKALRHEEDANMNDWFPRIFRNDYTPLTEMLASPGKQGVLGGLAGGGLGGLAGVAAGHALGRSGPVPGLAGAGLGALLGGVAAYGHRRKENDKILDSLRRAPVGATIGDMKKIQTAEKPAADEDIFAAVQRLKKKTDPPVPDVGGRTPDTPGEKAAAQADTTLASPNRSGTGESKGLSFQSKPDHYAKGEEAWDSVKHYFKTKGRTSPNPFAGKHALDKEAGIASVVNRLFRTAGSKSSEALGKTVKAPAGVDPMATTLLHRPSLRRPSAPVPMAAAPMADGVTNPQRHAEAMTQIQQRFPMLHDWLTKRSMDKLAGIPFGPLGRWGGRLFGAGERAAPKLQQAAGHVPNPRAPGLVPHAVPVTPAGQAQMGMPRPNMPVPHTQPTMPKLTPPAPPPAPPVPQRGALSRYWQHPVTHNVVQSGLGAIGGGFAGDDVPWNTGSDWGNAAVGAAAFNPRLRKLMARRGVGAAGNLPMQMARGGIIGSAGGSGLDQIAMLSGLTVTDPNTGEVMPATNFARMGGTLGTGFGGVRGAGQAMRGMSQAGSRMNRLGGQMAQFGAGATNPLMGTVKRVANAGQAGRAGALPMNRMARMGAMTSLGATGILGAHQAFEGAKANMTEHGLNVADEYLQQKMPQIMDYGQERMNDYLDQLGLVNQQGQLDAGDLFRRSAGHALGSTTDALLSRMGMDPRRMSPVQKAMIFGGGGAAGLGAVTGNPLLAGGGALALMGGMVPGMMPDRNAQFPGLGQSQAPTQPSARDEWMLQQQLNGV